MLLSNGVQYAFNEGVTARDALVSDGGPGQLFEQTEVVEERKILVRRVFFCRRGLLMPP
jgi:hypothetical protein